jgi:hypothetical protein
MKNLIKNNFLSLIESKKQSLGNKNVEKNVKVWLRNVPSTGRVGCFIAP